MDPKTTTEPATQDPGVVEATQPEEQPATAVTTSEPEPTTTQQQPVEPVQPDNSEEVDYEAWLEKKGVDPSTPEGRAAIAKSWREMEKKMHSTTKQASDLTKTVESTPVTTDDQRVQRLETLYTVTQWKTANKITDDQDYAMGAYLDANPVKKQMLVSGLIDLDDVMSMSGANKIDPTAARQQGGKEALEKLASKQLATAPTGSATTAKTPPFDPIAAALAD